ncbi:Haloacid dehalogenase-like hydrolase domain-containing protein Sgpp isoform F [Glycine soja]|uniref:Haloacid dehalogenase-like hydrolase domain-containing protein Sgpp isoform F n=1 Tax=Glycine soja TaxID=3848 RepID=A0A445M5Z5_GLYSO|nr:Haloacid dehalogenase-like hydrolase domain-containing protein Sgpp isoform F [Glycine soja]
MTVSSENGVSSGQSSLTGLAPLEAVLFDIDGTLCDSDPLHYYAFREMLLEIGFNGGVPISEEFFIDTVAGKHNDDIALVLFPGDLERGLKFVDDKEAMFRRLAAEQLKPLNGLDKVRKWIENHGLKRAAVTNAPRANAELMISILGLSDFFDAVIIGGECEHAKPHPDPYLKGLEALKASKDHTFVFEDSVSGIKAGVAAGMPVIGLATRNPENLLMEAKPAFLIKDYEDPKLLAAEQLKPLKGLDKVRKWVENRGLKRAAVTNAPRENAELMISKLGLSNFFEAVIIGGECDHAKPHPDPYLKGLEALKASKDHTFVFEDSVSGILLSSTRIKLQIFYFPRTL